MLLFAKENLQKTVTKCEKAHHLIAIWIAGRLLVRNHGSDLDCQARMFALVHSVKCFEKIQAAKLLSEEFSQALS